MRPDALPGSARSAFAALCRTSWSGGAWSVSAPRRGLLTALLLLTAPALTGSLPAQQPAAPPLPGLPGAWRVLPEFSDEFDAPPLDRSKWQPSNPEWGGHPPALYQESNVSLRNGQLLLRMKAGSVPDMPEGYRDYTCAIVRSRQRVRYGYFEIRAQAGPSAATSAFWFYHNGPDIWTEIDVFELSPGHKKYGRTLFTNAPVIRYPGQTGELSHKQEFPLRMDPAAAFHTWGLLWDEQLLTWYLDGKPLRTLANTHWKTPLRLILDTETIPHWLGLPDPATLPASFVVDYVRSWQPVPPGP